MRKMRREINEFLFINKMYEIFYTLLLENKTYIVHCSYSISIHKNITNEETDTHREVEVQRAESERRNIRIRIHSFIFAHPDGSHSNVNLLLSNFVPCMHSLFYPIYARSQISVLFQCFSLLLSFSWRVLFMLNVLFP